MNKNKLFSSRDRPVPPLRRDIQLIPLQNNGNNLLFFHDLLGYAPGNFALDATAEPVLSLINGKYSIRQISHILKGKIGPSELLDFVQLLDQNCLLESDFYKKTANETEIAFEANPVRPAALAGDSYPADPSELEEYTGKILSAKIGTKPGRNLKALYAPHIDPNVGAKVYGSAFTWLAGLKPKRVVILATAHYTGYYPSLYQDKPFIGSVKTFELPGTNFDTDTPYLQALESTGKEMGFTLQDRAHRIEHSIELHLLFLSGIWKHEFRIVPILVNNFEDLLYMDEGDLGQKVDRFSEKLQELDNEETFYLVSGDLSHVGKKFGDREAATAMKSGVLEFDKQFMKLASANQNRELLLHMQSQYDRYRICGFPPLYTFLNAFPGLDGEEIDYFWWDEKERESAVSFGAIGYRTPE